MTTVHIAQLMQQSGVRFGTSGARGLVDSMTDEVCYAYTAAYLQGALGGIDKDMPVLIGHDLRPSSPRIARACAAAIADAGGRVMYAGTLPTPALALYGQHLKAPAVVITGSHIPFNRNGIKFYRAEGEISKADEVAIQTAEVEVPESISDVPLPKPFEAAATHYLQRYVGFFGTTALAGMRIALYEHSSVGRDILRRILESLGAQVISLGRTDTFVPIDTEAVRAEDIAQALAWAKVYDFDAILSTDGDADRPLIGDETGNWLRGDLVGALCARFLDADIVVTPVSSNTAVEKSAWFKKVVRTRIGSPYVVAAMEQESSLSPRARVVGYEANGGFLLGSRIERNGQALEALPTRDAALPMLVLLAMAHARRCKLSTLSADLPCRFTASDRLQEFPAERSGMLIAKLQHDLVAASKTLAPRSGDVIQVDATDGLRLWFDNGDIVHLRPSGNAPELRCYAEAGTPDAAQLLCVECLSLIAGVSS